MLTTGLIGGLLVGLMLLAQLRGMLGRPDFFPDAVLLMVLVLGPTGPTLFSRIPGALTIVWFITLFWRQTETSVALPSSTEEQR